jgi:agmatinase
MTIEIPKTNPPAANSFVNLPVVTDWQDLQAEAVIFGVPHGKPYLADQFPNDQSTAPAALRKASPRILLDGQSLDADFQRAVCLDDFTIVDGGDIPLRGEDVQQHYDAAENAVRFAVQRGIMPISIGGDDGVTNPVIRGLDGLSDVILIQIDAHLDWRDERYGIHDGYSSPMRRAAEQDHITAIHQIGIRSFGSAKQPETDMARRWGAKIHLAQDIHRHGMAPLIAALPSSGRFFVTLDVDGLDPSVMPGTVALAPGGLMWWHIIELFEALAAKGQILGLNLVELAPKNDLNQISMIGAGRLILKLIMLQLMKSRGKTGQGGSVHGAPVCGDPI